MKTIKQRLHQTVWTILLAFCIVGFIYPVIGAVALLCMIAPIAMAFFKGRMWCGVYCPRGSFNDIVLAKFSYKRKVPVLVKQNWLRILFLIILMGAFLVQLILGWGNAVAIGRVFVRMIILTTLIAIILGIIYQPRTWCLICPMGTMAHYVSKLRSVKMKIKHINFNKDFCVDCKICSRNCPINIDVHSYKEEGKVLNEDCLKCNVCVEKCPRKALYFD